MRSKSRECAFKVIFSEEFEGGGESRRAVYRASELDEEETEYADRLVSLVEEHREELSAVLDKFSIGFSEKRSLAEILYVDDVPDVVSIDEAVGLVKKYSTEKSAGFVNGILAAVIAGDKT